MDALRQVSRSHGSPSLHPSIISQRPPLPRGFTATTFPSNAATGSNLWGRFLGSFTRLVESPEQLLDRFRYEIAAFAISTFVFLLVFVLPVPSDLQRHLQVLIDVGNGTRLPSLNFLYYLTVWSLAGFTSNIGLLQLAAVIVLSAAVAMQVYVTKRIFYDYITASGREVTRPDRIPLTAFLLAFAFSLPTANVLKGWYYVGQTPPNIWHNSTTIFIMPFALLLFWLSYKQLSDPQKSRISLIALLAVLTILIKPNFFLIFAVVYPLFLLTTVGIGRNFFKNVLPIWIPGAVLLVIEYVIAQHNPAVATDPQSVGQLGITISPFRVWSYYQSNIPLSILASLLFPIAFFCFYPRQLYTNLLAKYALVSLFAAFAMYAFFSETGPRWTDGNFGWQRFPYTYIMFATTCLLLIERNLPKLELRNMSKKDKVILLVFLIQVVSGFVYLAKMLLSQSYS